MIGIGVPEDHIIRIALDSIENRAFRDADELYKEIVSSLVDDAPYYVMIDEIQLADGFVDVVNSLKRRKNIDLYITGSNSRFLSSDIVTEFRGRGTEINVRPLSFFEYLPASGMDERTAWHSYLTYGGLPETLAIDEGERMNYLSKLIDVVYMRDIVERRGIKRPDAFDSVFSLLSSAVGSLTNPNRINNIMNNKGQDIDGGTVAE